MNKEELNILEEIINEEIKECLASGFGLQHNYIVTLRNMLQKLGLKEIYNFERWR